MSVAAAVDSMSKSAIFIVVVVVVVEKKKSEIIGLVQGKQVEEISKRAK